ncbi:hypothetical protein LJR090_001790 [Bosea sp. LjRoot90]|uniref:hypothetical protein n=1 Tax=Bosea sp. LjRoot90 TaxID=3342342 RepID=UPI003ECE16A9
MISVEALEQRLDAMAAVALCREERRLDLAGATKGERAHAMAKVRVKVKAWRDRASGSALRAAVPSDAGRSLCG